MMQESTKKDFLKKEGNNKANDKKSSKYIIDDISEKIEAGLTTCYGDHHTWNKKTTD